MALYDSEGYLQLQQVIRDITPYKTKKEIRSAPRVIRREYNKWRLLLGVTDGRLSPTTVRAEFKKYKRRALIFKSQVLNYDLRDSPYFDSFDKYDTSNKLVAHVTNAMMIHDVKLADIQVKSKTIHIGYKVTQTIRGVEFNITDSSNVAFFNDLPDNYRINIDGVNYNKTGEEFIFDYHNQSNDFAQSLDSKVVDRNLFIYKV